MTDRLLNEVVDRVAEAVAQRLLDRIPAWQPEFAQTVGLIDEPTMAGMANVSPQSLARRRKSGDIPYVQFGRRVLYRPAEVIAAMAGNYEGGAV